MQNNFTLFKVDKVDAKVDMALAKLRDLTGSLNVEYKYVNTSASSQPTTTGAITFLSGIAEGNSNVTRDGEQVKITSIHWKAVMTQHASASLTFARVIIFIDNSQDGTPPTVANLLTTDSATGHRNIAFKNRFAVLYDKVISMGDKTVRNFEFFKKLNMKATYSSSLATNAAATGNHLFIYLYSSEPTNYPTLYWDVRLRYVDN